MRHRPEQSVSSPRAAELLRAIVARITALAQAEGANPTAIDGLVLFRHSAPSPCYWTTCEPSLTLFAQGRKLIGLGGTEYLCEEGSCLVSAIDAPIQSQILEAAAGAPFLSMRVRLEMDALQEVLGREDLAVPRGAPDQRGLAVGRADEALLGACWRLLELLDTPGDAPFLYRLLQLELAWRVLKSPQGGLLRAIATRGNFSNRAARAIAWLRANYTKPLCMAELARHAGMGVSTLHHHFRALTGMSPLQYQKQLRLQAARHRMLVEGMDASTAAFAVGYQSVSQFSREYRRLFGLPPARDIQRLRRGEGPVPSAA